MTETAPPGRLRAARREPVREVGGDLLQLRVPRQHLPPARARCSSRCRAPCPSPRSTPAWSASSAWSTTPSSRRCARPPRRAAQAYAAAFARGDRPRTRCSRSWRPYVLYETLGPTLPDGPRERGRPLGPGPPLRDDLPGCRAPRRATPTATRSSTRCSPRRSGVTFTRDEYEDDFERIVASRQPDRARDARAARRARGARRTARRARRATSSRSSCPSGERRSFTANTIFRDPRLAQARRRRRAAGQRRTTPTRLGLVDGGARAGDHRARAAPRRPSRSATRCWPATPRCRTASASTTPARTARPVVTGVAPELAHLV